jgi:hypothetical protein
VPLADGRAALVQQARAGGVHERAGGRNGGEGVGGVVKARSPDELYGQAAITAEAAAARDRGHALASHVYEQLAAAHRRVGDDVQAVPSNSPGNAATAQPCPGTPSSGDTSRLPPSARLPPHPSHDLAPGPPTRRDARLQRRPPTEPGKPPNFHALIYTLDLLLPIIDFGQEKAFSPGGAYQWLAYLLVAAGWILATTRAVNRQ